MKHKPRLLEQLLLLIVLGFLCLSLGGGCGQSVSYPPQQKQTVLESIPRTPPQTLRPLNFGAIHYTYTDVYAQPHIDSERLTQCVYGDIVLIEAEKPGWYEVKVGPYPELSGWLYKAAVTVLPPASQYVKERNMTTIVIRQKASRVFVWPSTAIDIVMGTELPFIGESGQWYLVRLPNNDVGRIATDAVYPSVVVQPLIRSKKESQPVVEDISEQRLSIVATAQSFLGSVYVWGGTTPRGFDCSGLSYLVYKLNGIELPRVSWLQFHESIGAVVKKSQLAHGDLVFFQTYRKGPSHVGIYIGDNRFIHASPSYGVTISDLDEPYFRSRYIGAKTILSSTS